MGQFLKGVEQTLCQPSIKTPKARHKKLLTNCFYCYFYNILNRDRAASAVLATKVVSIRRCSKGNEMVMLLAFLDDLNRLPHYCKHAKKHRNAAAKEKGYSQRKLAH
ncbi:hypothetical protein G8764_09555 [Pseudomaricurvus alcaniphilus]|uniref:hypothetical protein n=1 Tax=Pseudomaricurvus alcaniphilus TaxID=1166482 RepID=UPI00140B57BD|nr:hypothetical protein [Pseudomaricurvus alcaniphilus]NHN37536.1 hypothetical protein [Pseudomaricurvus alcaniphilus]